jgi:hypothetical protein
MSRYRLLPTPAQQAALRGHCSHARYVWNLAVDVNAARNIAAGHATNLPIPLHARGGDRVTRPVNREPQLLLRSA